MDGCLLAFAIVAWVGICGGVGLWAARQVGRDVEGVVLGLLGGPIGWVAVLLLPMPTWLVAQRRFQEEYDLERERQGIPHRPAKKRW